MTAIFAVASVSLATADTDNILETSVAGISDFSSLTVDYGTPASTVSVSSADSGSVTLDFGTTFAPRNFSVTLALNYDTLVSLAEESSGQFLAKATGAYDLGLAVNTSQAFQGWWNGGLYANLKTSSLSSFASQVVDGTLLVTLVSGSNDAITNTSRIYIGDNATEFYSASGLVGTCNYQSVTINGTYADAVESVYVFDSTLSQTQVASVNSAVRTLSVPEPASASLSLLALGVLALRRRR